jgi:aspartate/methionine/tyrosine aminotransferase
MENLGISQAALNLRQSITHGTKAKILELNQKSDANNQVIDLSIGTLDEKTNSRIDEAVKNYISNNSAIIHEFAPVKGFPFLRKSISERVKRLRDINFNPETEIMVTPGGIKGAITVVFHTLINPDDEVIYPVPNWPHYADMIELHLGKAKPIYVKNFYNETLDIKLLEETITDKTKIIILGDCLNPSGKIYSHEDFKEISKVILNINNQRIKSNLSPVYVLFDCPYESHILNSKPANLSNISHNFDEKMHSMWDYTIYITGPGKTYGMHGDRAGYICASEKLIKVMEKVQVNLNSFASTYAQIATHEAMQEYMDDIAKNRAVMARKNMQTFIEDLKSCAGLNVNEPEGGFFLFLDLTKYGKKIEKLGFESADQYLLEIAKVASIGGMHFGENIDDLRHYIRMNCGRDPITLKAAAKRIKDALEKLD